MQHKLFNSLGDNTHLYKATALSSLFPISENVRNSGGLPNSEWNRELVSFSYTAQEVTVGMLT